jgi:hypothetical protein
MNSARSLVIDQSNLLDAMAAELTVAGYYFMLQMVNAGSWIELELDLWAIIRESLRDNRLNSALLVQRGTPVGLSDRLINVLIQRGYRIALAHGIRGSYRDLEAGLERAFRSVLQNFRKLNRLQYRGKFGSEA